MTAVSQYTPLDEIDKIYKELTTAFESGRTKSIDFRKQQLLRFAYMLRDNVDRIIDAIYEDIGKPKQEAVAADVATILGDTLWAHNHIEDWVKPEPVEKHPVDAAFNPVLIKESKGVVVIITAFNYPLFNARGIPGAIAAGCAFVWKPSELIPKTNALFAELFHKYMDESLYRLVQGAIPEIQKLLSYQWGHILYVGGPRGGKAVAIGAANTFTPITLELGGKNPAILHSSATLDIAARVILWGRYSNAGQACVGLDYIIVLDKDKEALEKALLTAYQNAYGNNPRASLTRLKVGGHYDRVNDMLKKTKGKIIAGGETDAEEFYIAPTIVTDLDWEDSLMQGEVFGPIVCIVGVPTYEEAFSKIKRYGQPLAAYCFHNDEQFADYARDNIVSGTWVENEALMPHGAVTIPLSGRGNSGMGRGYKGKTSFDEFTYLRPSCRVPEQIELNPMFQARYAPYTKEKLAGTIKFLIPEISAPRPDGI